ncbi:response regulator [Ramlibacter sp.]|uniref:hybrid sensor histidine kinase/response regulator n=1 Tax=Ramlibacter sp. TaxID=1917967 RepID=UPI003D11E55F
MTEGAIEREVEEAALEVLLLEDSRFDAELLRESLLAVWPNARLTVVRDETGFATALPSRPWSVILSDYEIPGYSGEQALAHARATRPEIPFIFVSGVIGEDNAVEMLKRGATDYVSKGRLARLPVVLRRALREARERAALGRTQSELTTANDVYDRVVNALRNYAVILLDPSGAVTSWNRAAHDIFGYTREQMLGRTAQAIFTPEDRDARVLQTEMRLALETGAADDNRWMMRSDGLALWAEGVMVPLFDAQHAHSGFCKVLRDATADYRDAEALRAAKAQAERANEAKDRFLAILSHELRTPLSPISTASVLLERVVTVPEKFRDLLPMIRRNVALEARLIDDLLDLTAISAGKVSLKLEPVDMHKLVAAVVEMLEEPLRDGELQLVLELDAASCRVNADSARMQQVLWNLVRNAVKFTTAGGTIRIRTTSTRREFTLMVQDTGIGIDPDAIGSIFVAFEQADREVTRRFGGLGLGLAIARGLVGQHQGELTAHSEGRNQGSTFTLQLPLAPEAVAGAPGEAGPAQDDEDGHALHVLLVEDSVDAAETMKMLLEAYGWRVTHAATCRSALELGRDGGFDVVLTDLGLPDGSGIDVGRELSARYPVVALSGYGAAPDLRSSAMAGFADHLVKPAEPQAVHKALERAIARRTAT